MELDKLPKTKGINRRKKRLGMGPGSGTGKTSGRGHKGSGARSGYSISPSFEGGQTPLALKLPRRGFNNARFANSFTIINLDHLQKLDPAINEVDRAVLLNSGLLRKKDKQPIKVLGNGVISRALIVKLDAFSNAAKEKIVAAGGKALPL